VRICRLKYGELQRARHPNPITPTPCARDVASLRVETLQGRSAPGEGLHRSGGVGRT
jgi:hypothetical protein